MRKFDILSELVSLCKDLSAQARAQVHYYQASVYKTEAKKNIEEKISQLQDIINLIPINQLKEPFLDYSSEKKFQHNFNSNYDFSARVLRLIHAINQELDIIDSTQLQLVQNDLQLTEIKSIKQQLVSYCRPGSQSWDFLQKI